MIGGHVHKESRGAKKSPSRRGHYPEGVNASLGIFYKERLAKCSRWCSLYNEERMRKAQGFRRDA